MYPSQYPFVVSISHYHYLLFQHHVGSISRVSCVPFVFVCRQDDTPMSANSNARDLMLTTHSKPPILPPPVQHQQPVHAFDSHQQE